MSMFQDLLVEPMDVENVDSQPLVAIVNQVNPEPNREWVYTLDLFEAYVQLKKLGPYVESLEWLNRDSNNTNNVVEIELDIEQSDEPDAEAIPKDEPELEPKDEPKPEPKDEPKSEDKSEPNPEDKSEPNAEDKSEPIPEDKSEPIPEDKSEPNPEGWPSNVRFDQGMDIFEAVMFGMAKFVNDPDISPKVKFDVVKNYIDILTLVPEALEANWVILEAVLVQLLVYMKDGRLQELACRKFKKLAKSCGASMIIQHGSKEPFIESLLPAINDITSDLKPAEILTFYEALALIVQNVQIYVREVSGKIEIDEKENARREKYVETILGRWHDAWNVVVSNIKSSESENPIHDVSVLSMLLKIVTIFCEILGGSVWFQIEKIYPDMLTIYKIYSTRIKLEKLSAVKEKKEKDSELVELMLEARKDCMKLIQRWIRISPGGDVGQTILLEHNLPKFLEIVYDEFEVKPNVEIGDPDVLVTIATFLVELGEAIPTPKFEEIIKKIFGKSRLLFATDPGELPVEEHRNALFTFLKVLNIPCFWRLLHKVYDYHPVKMDFIRAQVVSVAERLQGAQQNLAVVAQADSSVVGSSNIN